MMVITPNTEVRLLSAVPLTNSYEHQLTFSDTWQQEVYFDSKRTHTFSDFTYQREDSSIKVPKGRDALYNCNYIMYRNKDFTSKWFYAFITKLEYVNPDTTKVHFEIDVYQTWMFDIKFRSSFVAREHLKRWNPDGSPMVYTVDEGLDYGTEYDTVSVTQYVPYNDVFFLVVVCKNRMDVNGNNQITPMINGSPQPLTYYLHPFKMDGSSPGVTIDGMGINLSSFQDVLKALYKQTNAVNNIVSLYVTEFPGFAFPSNLAMSSVHFEHVTIQDSSTSFNTIYVKSLKAYGTLTQNMGNKYDGFNAVTESKLLMHPYTVTILTDMKGNQFEIKNEHIWGNNLEITVRGSLGTSNKVAYNVKNYRTAIDNETTLLNGIINNNPNDVPIITDLLSAYLQGNRNSIANQANHMLFNSVFSALGNTLTANLGGAIVEGGNSYFSVQGMLAKMKDIENTPPQLNSLGGNTAFDYGNNIKGVYIIKKQITAEYRRKLTDFFKMYGYKINEVKVPNLKSRKHYNYIQTVGANITGNIPGDDLAKIKTMFDTGVTLWHGDWVGDYSLDNGER